MATRASFVVGIVLVTACVPRPPPPVPRGPGVGVGVGVGVVVAPPWSSAPPSAPARLALGQYHACAVDVDGRVACWGGNHVAQLGNGGLDHDPQPRYVVGPRAVISLAAGSGQTCAVAGDGAVWCWGGNFVGEAGQPLGELVITPQVVGGLPPMQRVSAGMERTCGVSTTRELWCWGASVRQTGRPPVAPARLWPDVAGAVAVDEDAVCAVTGAREVRCWTRPEDATVPAIALAVADVVELVVLQGHVATRDQAGQIRIFDWNQGREATAATGWHRALPSGGLATAIAGGGPRLCVVAGGAVRCRGNRHEVDLPVEVGATVVATAAALCALGPGAIRCSGDGERGQLGDGRAGGGVVGAWVTVLPAAAPRDQRPPPPVATIAAASACPASAPQALALVASPIDPVRARLCGNGTIDGGEDLSTPPVCAPCMPGNSCPCSRPIWREACDGRPPPGATCTSLGYFGGTLACGPTCTLDRGGCRACADGPGVTCALTRVAAAPMAGLAAVRSADALGVAWGEAATACGQHLAVFDEPLTARADVRFGVDGEAVLDLAATAGGFVAATAGADGGHLTFFDRAGRAQRALEVRGAAPAFVVATARGQVWLGLWQAVRSSEPGFGGQTLRIARVDDAGALGPLTSVVTVRAPIAVRALVHGDGLSLIMSRTVVRLALGASAEVTGATRVGADDGLVTLDFDGAPVQVAIDGPGATITRPGQAGAQATDLAGPLQAPAAPLDLGRRAALFTSGQRLGVLELATGRLRPVRATTYPSIGRVVERADRGDVIVVWIEGGALGLARVSAP